MSETQKILQRDVNYTVRKIAEDVSVIKDDFLDKDSLGPFVRISQNTDNIIYLLAYFTKGIEIDDFEVEEIQGGNITLHETEIDQYAINIKAKIKSVFEEKQNLWAFVIKAGVDLISSKLVICNVNFNYIKPDSNVAIPDNVLESLNSSLFKEFKTHYNENKPIDQQLKAKEILEKLMVEFNIDISIKKLIPMLIFLGDPNRGTKVIIVK